MFSYLLHHLAVALKNSAGGPDFEEIFLNQEHRGLMSMVYSYVRWNTYGEVNSVKRHNYKIWLNDGVY